MRKHVMAAKIMKYIEDVNMATGEVFEITPDGRIWRNRQEEFFCVKRHTEEHNVAYEWFAGHEVKAFVDDFGCPEIIRITTEGGVKYYGPWGHPVVYNGRSGCCAKDILRAIDSGEIKPLG